MLYQVGFSEAIRRGVLNERYQAKSLIELHVFGDLSVKPIRPSDEMRVQGLNAPQSAQPFFNECIGLFAPVENQV